MRREDYRAARLKQGCGFAEHSPDGQPWTRGGAAGVQTGQTPPDSFRRVSGLLAGCTPAQEWAYENHNSQGRPTRSAEPAVTSPAWMRFATRSGWWFTTRMGAPHTATRARSSRDCWKRASPTWPEACTPTPTRHGRGSTDTPITTSIKFSRRGSRGRSPSGRRTTRRLEPRRKRWRP